MVKDLKKHKIYQKYSPPLQQVYTYCLHTGRRYGYIITDEELVVFVEGSSISSDYLITLVISMWQQLLSSALALRAQENHDYSRF